MLGIDKTTGQQLDGNAHLAQSIGEILSTPLIEKEAFRTLFAVGGGFDRLEASGVSGVPAARANAEAYLASILDLLKTPTSPSN